MENIYSKKQVFLPIIYTERAKKKELKILSPEIRINKPLY